MYLFWSLIYKRTKLYIADPNDVEPYYVKADNLQEMNLNSTAGEIIQRSKELFPSAEKTLVILKLF